MYRHSILKTMSYLHILFEESFLIANLCFLAKTVAYLVQNTPLERFSSNCKHLNSKRLFFSKSFYGKISPFLLLVFLIFLDLFSLFPLSCSRFIGFPLEGTGINLTTSWPIARFFYKGIYNILLLYDYMMSFPVFYHA